MEQPARCRLANCCGAWVHCIGVFEVVMRVNVGFVQDGARRAGNADSVDSDFRSQRVVKVRIHSRYSSG